MTFAILFLHVRRSRKELASDRRKHVMMALRLALPYLILSLVFHFFSVRLFLGYTVFFLLLFFSYIMWTFNIFSFPFIMLGFIFYEWALGFPDRKKCINTAIIAKDTKEDDNVSVIGREARTLPSLKPTGKILVGDRAYDATCEHGFLEKDKLVRVLRKKTGNLLVSKIEK
ncbi:MAG: NfeD family protein [Candidatus Aureabacteria bacterium]|nr:NfeD family protein [Candidatus Auribacterota bacterium]